MGEATQGTHLTLGAWWLGLSGAQAWVPTLGFRPICGLQLGERENELRIYLHSGPRTSWKNSLYEKKEMMVKLGGKT